MGASVSVCTSQLACVHAHRLMYIVAAGRRDHAAHFCRADMRRILSEENEEVLGPVCLRSIHKPSMTVAGRGMSVAFSS